MIDVSRGLWLLVLGFVFHAYSMIAQPTDSADDSLAMAFIQELNDMRANPKSYIPKIDAYQQQVSSFTPDKKALRKAVKEIKTELAKLKPLPPLVFDSALAKAAMDHVEDAARTGIVGHIGSDRSDPALRVAKYGRFTSLAESITYGHLSTSLMLAAFLVDEGTPSRGHRKAMLTSDLLLIGAATGIHPKYNTQIVVVTGRR